jgi:predicted dehydrogenase
MSLSRAASPVPFNPVSDVLRIGVVGCGQIADAHLGEIAKVKGAQAIAVCDREPDLAYQAAARFGIQQRYNDLGTMLSEAKVDVVHLTTPPHTHFQLAAMCIQHGRHVYVEKPLALSADETRRLLDLAAKNNRLVCVGHDHLFDPVWTEARQLIRDGRLGTVVHIDSQQGYDPDGPFGRLIQTDPQHWVHKLPGGIFHNVISHAISKVTPFLVDEYPETFAIAFSSRDVSVLPTELRVILRGESVTANISLFSRAKPVRRVVRLYGTKAEVEVDFDTGLIRVMRSTELPGAFGRIEAALRQAREATKNTRRVFTKFMRSELQYFAGMRALFDAFYEAIRQGGSPPISYDEIQRVANIMDAIFQQAACTVRTSDRMVRRDQRVSVSQ